MTKNKNIIYIGTLLISSTVILFMITVKYKSETDIVISAESIHQTIVDGGHFISPATVDSLMHNLSDGFVAIDLRKADEFDRSPTKRSINIPFQRILDEEYFNFISINGGKKILISSSEAKSAEAWILLKQAGIDDIFILKGGLPYWREIVEGKTVPSKIPGDEEPKYNFKQELSGAE